MTLTLENIDTAVGFAALGLSGVMLKATENAGFTEPKPIQVQAIPPQLEGRDILGIAQTGSGKTAAFSLPILAAIVGLGTRRKPRTARALILAPTRELAVQIEEMIRVLAKGLHISTALVLGGGVFFTLYEWHLTLADVPWWARILNGLFMSVTARTAGFNTIDYGAASDGTNFLTILLMFIGGSPGSTAGGLKTTTIALIGLLAWSRLRGQPRTSVLNRTVPDETIQRAVGLFVVAFGLVTAAIFVLTTTEIGVVTHVEAEAGFLRYMFEAVSAFNTVGLSMGVTDELSGPGRVVAVLLMYIGRVGPLTFAAAIALPRQRRTAFRYAYEDVVIG